MAFPTSVNNQITDAVTQANTKVLGGAPALAMGNLYQATAQALSNAAHNATTAQQQTAITAQAATTMGVTTLYSIDTAATGKATTTVLGSKKRQQSANYRVTPDTIIGHIHSKIYSPIGKQKVMEAVQQAQKSPKLNSLTEPMKQTQLEIEHAITKAREEGASDQSIGYTINEVLENKGLNSLFPALSAPDLTVEKVEAYYEAIIATHKI